MPDKTVLKLPNRQARGLWLSVQKLAETPTGTLDLPRLIHDLGFVQLDTIQVVARAHHHILWSRNQNYREPMLDKLLRARGIFEHYTHDASVLPMEFLPMWRRQFERMADRMANVHWKDSLPVDEERAAIRERIVQEGALSTHAFDTKVTGEREMWQRPPHKLALDYMWYVGELATCHRDGFTKVYDLVERVFPEALREEHRTENEQIDWLNRAALERIGFGSVGDIQRFWEAAASSEVRNWVHQADDLITVAVQGADGSWKEALALPDIEHRLNRLTAPSSRLRILNPFDPVIRDRNRLKFLFGFDYRVEMFVPAAKRIWGYYIYPLLEGDRVIGRCEIKADRRGGTLDVHKIWLESKVRWTPAREAKFEAEVGRMARFVGVKECRWNCDGPARPAD